MAQRAHLDGDGVQGCQIFLDLMDQNGGKYTKLFLNLQMAIKYANFSISRPSKFFPNYDFWFNDMPSGSPDGVSTKHGFTQQKPSDEFPKQVLHLGRLFQTRVCSLLIDWE
jgi:hypothetical protein